MLAIAIQTRINPALGPSGPKRNFDERMRATGQASAMIGIVVVTIGGIYSGIFTAGEAAGVGAFLAFSLALFRRSLNKKTLNDTLLQTVRTTAFAFLILVGAHVFNPFLALTEIPTTLAALLTGTNLPPMGILTILLVTFVILGTFLEGFAILVLTLPIVHPLIIQLGFDPIWFGVIMVIVLEMGLISPPVGVNVFVVKGIAEDVPMSEIFIGILPFWFAMFVCLILLVLFPQIALFLPNTMIS
jgi:tripartite ATP-independent transporter DctM subunit